jgi:flagellin-like hook-associated protein FlgL
MSDIHDLITEAQQNASSINSLLDDALAQADQVAPDFSSILSDLGDVLSNLTRAEENIPNRYTEVGEVADMGDSLENYLADADFALRSAIDAIELLQD